ncbi:MAG TPA: oligosaccharide flippase family protein, partial [Aggregatilineales bacterium]|nr:oligosaccharide flippase family protein [Aggregatilineales bacterium]
MSAPPVGVTSRLRSNTAILALNNVLAAGLAFLISVAIGRGLGARGLGQYSFIMAWIAPLIALADFGMGTLITRDVAQLPSSALPLLRTAMRTVLLIAAALIAGTWLMLPLLQLAQPVVLSLALMAFLIILDSCYGLYTALF